MPAYRDSRAYTCGERHSTLIYNCGIVLAARHSKTDALKQREYLLLRSQLRVMLEVGLPEIRASADLLSPLQLDTLTTTLPELTTDHAEDEIARDRRQCYSAEP